ncbi:carbohydrate porin [Pendulispora albinea]|uniref:Carbohydrate porin n=1 Tax=Pendulispora albinea TaxID=2741071 RepID=A0ABZ2LVP7_9BACT
MLRLRLRSAGACITAAAAALVCSMPNTASAEISSDRVEFMGYGRMGIGWTKSGQVVSGRYMNLTRRRALGGRLEEGDYLEPMMRLHLKKADKDKDTETTVDLVTSFEMYSSGGSVVSSLSNGDTDSIKIFPEQAYIQAKNVFTPGLEIWLGSRLYRKNDIHIADYYYFNNLPAQGVGAIYTRPGFGEIDVAILTKTGSSPFFRTNVGMPDGPPQQVTRQRTMFVAEYKYLFGPKTSFVQALGELHVVPRSGKQDIQTDAAVNPPDWGAVGGAKVHLDFGGDSFSDTSIRYGTRIANGAESGGSTFDTFGSTAADGTYKGAYGVELVEHFGIDIQRVVGINGYFAAHYSQGTSDLAPSATPRDANARSDYVVGVRPTIFVTDQFHMITEATFQTRKDDGKAQGMAVKLSVVPTIVPSGGRSMWTRPHIRGIYTLGIYNQAAQDQLMSQFLETVGPTKLAHFVGARTEWWF